MRKGTYAVSILGAGALMFSTLAYAGEDFMQEMRTAIFQKARQEALEENVAATESAGIDKKLSHNQKRLKALRIILKSEYEKHMAKNRPLPEILQSKTAQEYLSLTMETMNLEEQLGSYELKLRQANSYLTARGYSLLLLADGNNNKMLEPEEKKDLAAALEVGGSDDFALKLRLLALNKKMIRGAFDYLLQKYKMSDADAREWWDFLKEVREGT